MDPFKPNGRDDFEDFFDPAFPNNDFLNDGFDEPPSVFFSEHHATHGAEPQTPQNQTHQPIHDFHPITNPVTHELMQPAFHTPQSNHPIQLKPVENLPTFFDDPHPASFDQYSFAITSPQMSTTSFHPSMQAPSTHRAEKSPSPVYSSPSSTRSSSSHTFESDASSSSAGKIRTRRSKYAAKIEAVKLAGTEQINPIAPKVKPIADASREVARECRRRNKEKVDILEEKAQRLYAQIQELQERYWFTCEKVRSEQAMLAQEIESHVHQDEPELNYSALTHRFIDLAYNKGSHALMHHMDRIKELLEPSQQIKLILWGLNQDDEFYESSHRFHGQTLWNLLTHEMDWTPEQRVQLMQFRDTIRDHNRHLTKCIRVLDELRSEVTERRTSLLGNVNSIRSTMSPQQQAKFIAWVERNRNWIQNLNASMSLPPDPPQKPSFDPPPPERNGHRIRHSYPDIPESPASSGSDSARQSHQIPQSQTFQSQIPQSQIPQLQTFQSQFPQSQFPQSQFPQSQTFQSQFPQSQTHQIPQIPPNLISAFLSGNLSGLLENIDPTMVTSLFSGLDPTTLAGLVSALGPEFVSSVVAKLDPQITARFMAGLNIGATPASASASPNSMPAAVSHSGYAQKSPSSSSTSS